MNFEAQVFLNSSFHFIFHYSYLTPYVPLTLEEIRRAPECWPQMLGSPRASWRVSKEPSLGALRRMKEGTRKCKLLVHFGFGVSGELKERKKMVTAIQYGINRGYFRDPLLHSLLTTSKPRLRNSFRHAMWCSMKSSRSAGLGLVVRAFYGLYEEHQTAKASRFCVKCLHIWFMQGICRRVCMDTFTYMHGLFNSRNCWSLLGRRKSPVSNIPPA